MYNAFGLRGLTMPLPSPYFHYRSPHTSVWVVANVMNQGSCPLCFIRGWQR